MPEPGSTVDAVYTVLVAFFFVINTVYLVVLVFSILEIHRQKKMRITYDLDQAFRFRLLPPVSIILPAFNEEKTIEHSVRSLLFLRYPSYEVIVVNDGSSDRTLETLIGAFDLVKADYVFRKSIDTERVRGIYVSREHRNIVVVDKENGGKADALNAGINLSSYPYFCAIDADSILGQEALARLILPVINDPARTVAVGGVVKAANGSVIDKGRVLQERLPRNLLVLLQMVEYARSFFMGRIGLSALNSLLIISGAFGLFRKEDVLRVSGYRKKSMGEDMMLVVRLHRMERKERRRYRIAFVHDTVCWTEMPANLRTLRRQRVRWQMGLMESIFGNAGMFLNPRYGWVGVFAFPFYFFSEAVAPFAELLGYGLIGAGLYLGTMAPRAALSFLAVTLVYGAVHSFVALAMEQFMAGTALGFGRFLVKLLSAGLENLFYRQLNLVFRIWGVFKHLARKGEWGIMERRGFDA